MKFNKFGFTLAEVLITLGIIGVVAAITMPVLSSNGKYQQLGARLAKFNSVLEQAATEYALANGGSFTSGDDVYDFYKHSFIFKDASEADKIPYVDYLAGNAELKDGTKIVSLVTLSGGYAHSLNGAFGDPNVIGDTFFEIQFDPNVSGLHGTQYLFDVTEKGHVFPAQTNVNTCLNAIYNNNWKVKHAFFADGGACADNR